MYLLLKIVIFHCHVDFVLLNFRGVAEQFIGFVLFSLKTAPLRYAGEETLRIAVHDKDAYSCYPSTTNYGYESMSMIIHIQTSSTKAKWM